MSDMFFTQILAQSTLEFISSSPQCNSGAQPALHFGGGQFSWNFIRWRHRAYSAVVQPFRKQSHIIIKCFCTQTRSP